MASDFFILGIITVCYIFFFMISCVAWTKGSISLTGSTELIPALNGITVKHISGICVLGLPVISLYKPWMYLFAAPTDFSLVKELVLLVLMIAAAHIALLNGVRKSRTRQKHDSGRRTGKTSAVTLYLAIRIFFLVVYECFFRGLLLTVCIDVYGIPLAITINLIFYAGIHVFNGSAEMISCLPFGLLLCTLTIWYQSVMPAIALHLILSLVYENYLIFTPGLSPKIMKS